MQNYSKQTMNIEILCDIILRMSTFFWLNNLDKNVNDLKNSKKNIYDYNQKISKYFLKIDRLPKLIFPVDHLTIFFNFIRE